MRHTYRSFWAVLFIGATIGVLGGQLRAQTTGTIFGVITDQSGGLVPDVAVTLRNVSTEATRTNVSDSLGSYTFSLVLPGTYEITAEKTGFAKAIVQNVVVRVDSNTRTDISLQLAEKVQEVSVTAAAVAVDAESPSLGQVIGSTQIIDLPLNGRNFLQLAALTAGAYPPAPSSIAEGLSGGRQSITVSVSGSRESSSEFLFDGVQSKHDFYGAVGIEPPVDSISEFKIQQGYFSPQFGLPGVVNVVFKSGSNKFHGAGWEFLRNDVLDARNFFDAQKQPYKQNQFGGNLGGPILKNKLFFFGDYEGLRIRQSFTEFHRVPTQAMLQGDFSGLPTIYDPATFDPATGTKQPFPNNQIPSGRIDPFAQQYNQFIPAPNAAPDASLGGANFFGNRQFILDNNKTDFKVDYTKSQADSFFGRYSFITSPQHNTSILPGAGQTSPLRSHAGVFSWTHVFSPAIVNSFRAGLDRTFLNTFTADNYTGPDFPSSLGLKNLNQIPVCNAVPTVNLAGVEAYGFSFGNCVVTGNNNYVFLDNLSIVRGRHNLTAGGEVTHFYMRVVGAYNQMGSFNFTGQYTGNSVADYLIGSPQAATGSAPNSPFYFLSTIPVLYLNDDFHVTSKLTLNMGLRWQFLQPHVEKYDHFGYLDFQTGQVIYAGENGARRSPLFARYRDFSPRFGFAYSPRDNWAIRGSYGIFFDRMPGNQKAWGDLLPKFEGSYSVTGGLDVSGINISTLFPPASTDPQGPPGSFLAILVGDGPRGNAYLQQWTLSLQHTFPGNIFVEAAYVGSKGTHLSTRVDANTAPAPPAPGDDRPLEERRPFPHFSFILADEGRGDSYYNGLQLTVRKERGHGLSFLSAYTFASSLTTVGTWGDFAYRWRRFGRGASVDNVRHSWVPS